MDTKLPGSLFQWGEIACIVCGKKVPALESRGTATWTSLPKGWFVDVRYDSLIFACSTKCAEIESESR